MQNLLNVFHQFCFRLLLWYFRGDAFTPLRTTKKKGYPHTNFKLFVPKTVGVFFNSGAKIPLCRGYLYFTPLTADWPAIWSGLRNRHINGSCCCSPTPGIRMVNAATLLRTSASTISDIYMVPEYILPSTSIYLYYM